MTGNSGADFGNTYYNDHHFHYGYFIYCAAVIGHIDPTWIPANKDYVNTLVRDIANPSVQDKFFPVSRMFDWYHGHSWAHGLFETLDGKVGVYRSADDCAAWYRSVSLTSFSPRSGSGVELRGREPHLRDQDVGDSHRRRQHGGPG